MSDLPQESSDEDAFRTTKSKLKNSKKKKTQTSQKKGTPVETVSKNLFIY